MTRQVLLLALFLPAISMAGEPLPTLMTVRGRLLVDQTFGEPLPPINGKSNGFASGFRGWRYNAVDRGGRWEVKDSCFTGRENPAMNHPATTSFGFQFKDVIIQCEVRMNNAPLQGRKFRYLNVRTTDEKDYVCSIILSQAGFRIQKDDNDHAGPDRAVPLGERKLPLALDEWHEVLFEIKGDEMTATVNGTSLTGSHPLISSAKHSVMFVMGVEGSIRKLKAWEALPNPGWEGNKGRILAAQSKPASK